MLQISCTKCGRTFNADEAHIGKHLRCTNPSCGNIVPIVRSEIESIAETAYYSTRKNRQSQPGRKVVLGMTGIALVLGLCVASYVVGRNTNNGASSTETTSSDMPPKGVDPSDLGFKDESPSSPIETAKHEVPSPQHSKARSLPIENINQSQQSKRKPVELETGEFEDASSPPTGTRLIEDKATTGRGKLRAVNGSHNDAYVIVLDAKTHSRVRQISIRAQDTFTMEHLNQGNYEVFFATGIDWDGDAEKFRRNASYFEFGKPLLFEETEQSDGVLYDQHTITLNAVPDGNVRSIPISEAQFHAATGKHF